LIVFLSTLSIVLLSLVTVIFPALISKSISGFQDFETNFFETGIWAGPVIIINIILLGLSILFFKGKLPHLISRSIKFIFDFEVSRKVSFIVVTTLLFIYIIFSASEVLVEETFQDYLAPYGLKHFLERWNFDELTKTPEPHVRYFLLSMSMEIFGSYRVIPFISSICLLILTYFITVKISKKRFAGIISMVLVLQSSTFLTYDTTSTYSSFWVLFYVFSLYLVYKKWPLSPISYILSIPSKPLTILFLPMSLFFIFRSTLTKRKKILLGISYGAVILLIITSFVLFETFNPKSSVWFIGDISKFDSDDFWIGFTSMSPQLRFDGMILVFLLPLVVGLYISSRKGIIQADSIMVLILGMLLMPAVVAGITDQTNQPYRFLPLVVFFAIGVGILLSKVNQKI